MELKANNAVLELQRGQVITLDDATGASVMTRCGSIWMTEEGRHDDFVLGAGEKRVITTAGRTLLQAMKTSWVSIRKPASALN